MLEVVEVVDVVDVVVVELDGDVVVVDGVGAVVVEDAADVDDVVVGTEPCVVVVVEDTGGGGGVGKLHSAAAQSVGVAAWASRTPGSDESERTSSGAPAWRQASAGSAVVNALSIPTSWMTPPAAGVAIGVRAMLFVPSKLANARNPVPGGGPVRVSLATGAFPRRAASMAGSLPSMPSAQIPTPAMWK
jgi:hypothetical protein